MKVVNVSDLSEDWYWLRDEFVGCARGQGQEWVHYSSLGMGLSKLIPKRDSVSRMFAAWKAVNHAKTGPSVLVSHGPRPAMYSGAIAKLMRPDLPHLVYSFNFTNLPGGAQRIAMKNAFTQATRFVCFSNLERLLYSEYFEIPLEKIDMIHWSVHQPTAPSNEQPIEAGDYICALGSQGRDYATLFSAMKLIPNVRLVVVATKQSIEGLDVPSNVKIHINIPYSEAANILRHSRFMVLPLRDGEVPCGQVTVVAAMFHNKASVVTNSKGLHDYIQDGETGIFCTPRDSQSLVEKITCLWDDQTKAKLLGEQSLSFAQKNCTEQKVVNYFENFLSGLAN